MNLPVVTASDHARKFLADSAWLRAFPQGLRDEFLGLCKLLPQFERGQRVFNIGDPPDGIYGTVNGCFGFEIAPGDDGPQMAHQLWPGDWFGELAHVLDSPRLTTVQALCPSSCVRISARDLKTMLAKQPILWKYMALSLANDFQLATVAVHDLMERSPRKRVGATLLRLAGIRSEVSGQHQAMDLSLSHTSLSLLTSLSRSLVADTLHELESRAYVKCTYGHVHLIDPAGLRRWLAEQS